MRNIYGILLIILNLQKSLEMLEHFYAINNFKAYCICKIAIKKKGKINLPKNLENTDVKSSEGKSNSNSNQTINNKIIIINDDDDNDIDLYFLVGGLDIKEKKPLIKLYILNNNTEELNSKIKYVQDVKFEDCNNMSGAIICIIQSDKTGNILAINEIGRYQNFCIFKEQKK